MASKANQLAQLQRALGEVRVVFSDVRHQDVHEVYSAARGYMVPEYHGAVTHVLPVAAGATVCLLGQFSADVERHDVLWEMLERMPQVSCLVVYTDLPDHSFNFGPREL